jgi:hypothetical protein
MFLPWLFPYTNVVILTFHSLKQMHPYFLLIYCVTHIFHFSLILGAITAKKRGGSHSLSRSVVKSDRQLPNSHGLTNHAVVELSHLVLSVLLRFWPCIDAGIWGSRACKAQGRETWSDSRSGLKSRTWYGRSGTNLRTILSIRFEVPETHTIFYY